MTDDHSTPYWFPPWPPSWEDEDAELAAYAERELLDPAPTDDELRHRMRMG
jgi:hypothetical protein